MGYVHALVSPPLCLLLVAALGFVLQKHRPRAARLLIVLGFGGLALLSTPFAGRALLASLERYPALPASGELLVADAIVVLGAESLSSAAEYGGATLGAFSLERTRYAAHLARRTHAPVLCSGRASRDGERSVAELMGEALRVDWGVEARWIEPASTNTRENAERSAELLRAAGVRRIYVVSHAWHLARAVPCFEQLGFEVVPAPTGFHERQPFFALDLLPSAKGLRQSQLALHEWLGRAWYALQRGSAGA
jgi:uncharacterized SAM-binding protein YcdF (DUF218 family)